jgi:spermidine dehydrogenase
MAAQLFRDGRVPPRTRQRFALGSRMSRTHPRFGAGLGSAQISRRDVLNGLLLASGGIAVSQSAPLRALAGETPSGACDDVIGSDPRALRGGDLPSAFNVAHWMRDRRLSFQSDSVKLAPGCDAIEGSFAISDDSEQFDVIIVGAGLAGLSAAFYLLRRRHGTRILLLDTHDYAGGSAGRDEGAPLSVPGSTGGAYCVVPKTDYLQELYQQLKINPGEHPIPDPTDCYYFDEYTPGVRPDYRGWNINTFDLGLKQVPYEKNVVADLIRSRDWNKGKIGVVDPPDRSPSQYDYLSEMSLDHYLTEVLHCDPIVSDFYSLYTIDALGGDARHVNAHSALGFLDLEFSDDLFAFPGGTSELAKRLAAWLTKSTGAAHSYQPARFLLDSVALRIDVSVLTPKPKTSVVYCKNRAFRRATSKAVIVAAQSDSARRLVEHMLEGRRIAAWDKFNTVPVVVANVALRSAAPLVELGLGYSQAWWGSRHWADFVIGDWVTGDRRKEANRPTVLTFYGRNSAAPEDLPAERMKLLQTPFGEYEKSIKDDLSRIMRGSKFDFDRDVSAISLYRWGHSMVMPTPNLVFGNTHSAGGQLDRTESPRRIACSRLGPISFAGQHTEGTPSVESAIASGHRAALEILAQL